jgi:hyperosmotically inducible periplasmic protein
MTLPRDRNPEADRPGAAPGHPPARLPPRASRRPLRPLRPLRSPALHAKSASWCRRRGRRQPPAARTIAALACLGALASIALAAGCGRGSHGGGSAPAGSGAHAAAGAKAVEIQEDPVKTGIESADASLASKVRAGLAADPRLRLLHVEIDAEGGRVTLWGHVDRAEQRTAAEQLARRTPGVTSIVNHIKVD